MRRKRPQSQKARRKRNKLDDCGLLLAQQGMDETG